MKGYLVVKGSVNMFCPYCGKVLWEELPHGTSCMGCFGKITNEKSRRKTVTMKYVNELGRAHHEKD